MRILFNYLWPRAAFSTAVFVIGLMGVSQAQERFFLQIEAGQGLFFAPGVDPYTFSAQIHPALGFGATPKNFMLSASIAGVYDNPKWSLLWGGRLALYVSKLRKTPIKFGPNVSYGTLHLTVAALMESAELRRLAGGVILDIWEGALLISPRFGYDRKLERNFLEIGLGLGF
jgi:hypothetical protein